MYLHFLDNSGYLNTLDVSTSVIYPIVKLQSLCHLYYPRRKQYVNAVYVTDMRRFTDDITQTTVHCWNNADQEKKNNGLIIYTASDNSIQIIAIEEEVNSPGILTTNVP